jgi:hypothetical protein
MLKIPLTPEGLPMRFPLRRPLTWVCSVAALLLAAPGAAAQDALQKDINAAIDQGVKHLRGQQGEDGKWPHQHIGATALAGWTLLECGAARTDPAVAKAADAVRKECPNLKYTYSVALAIIFLDRLGDPQDVPLIEALTVRLIAGQNRRDGGWGYFCPDPDFGEVQRLQQVIQNRKELKEDPKDVPTRRPRDVKDVPKEILEQIKKIEQAAPDVGETSTDNSNTQFAMLALWVGRRAGLPVDRALTAVERRFRAGQAKNGGWGYIIADPKLPGMQFNKAVQPTPQMTCTGLMALALGVGISDPKAEKDWLKDPAIKAGFQLLSTVLKDPVGDRSKVQKLDKNAGKGYYFLWTLERTAVIFHAGTIAGKDWYRWGAEILVVSQNADGSWNGEYSEGSCDTCFALLFLKQANLAPDLTARIIGVERKPGEPPPRLLEGYIDPLDPKAGKKKAPPKKDTPPPKKPGGQSSSVVPPQRSWSMAQAEPVRLIPSQPAMGRLQRLLLVV